VDAARRPWLEPGCGRSVGEDQRAALKRFFCVQSVEREDGVESAMSQVGARDGANLRMRREEPVEHPSGCLFDVLPGERREDDRQPVFHHRPFHLKP